MDEFEFYFFFRVCQRAVLAKAAFFLCRSIDTELFFVVVWVVQLLHCVVGERTAFVFAVRNSAKIFRILVLDVGASTLLFVVVVLAEDCVVFGGVGAWFSFVMLRIDFFFLLGFWLLHY